MTRQFKDFREPIKELDEPILAEAPADEVLGECHG
jgi:hypothetical protein